MSATLTIEEVVEFRKRVIEHTERFSTERTVFSCVLYGHYDKVDDMLEVAKEDIDFMKGGN